MNAYLLAVSSSLFALCACSGGNLAAPDAPPLQEPVPPPLDAGPPTGAGTSVFAIRNIEFGDKGANGADSTAAWKSLGFDIDGLATTAESTDVCQPAMGAPRSGQTDGINGIDNSFGENILPIILTVFASDTTTLFNQSLDAGLVSTLLAIDGLGTDSNAAPLAARLLVGAPVSATPKWQGNDIFPIDAVSLDALGAARVAFADGYVHDGTFVGSPASGLGAISIGVFSQSYLIDAPSEIRFTIPATHLRIEMQLTPDASGATNGVLSGILPADSLASFATNVAGHFNSSLCTEKSIASITTVIEQAADILVDGTQDPTKPCNGISIGLGFSASRVKVGEVTTVAPTPDSCATAGENR